MTMSKTSDTIVINSGIESTFESAICKNAFKCVDYSTPHDFIRKCFGRKECKGLEMKGTRKNNLVFKCSSAELQSAVFLSYGACY